MSKSQPKPQGKPQGKPQPKYQVKQVKDFINDYNEIHVLIKKYKSLESDSLMCALIRFGKIDYMQNNWIEAILESEVFKTVFFERHIIKLYATLH